LAVVLVTLCVPPAVAAETEPPHELHVVLVALHPAVQLP
jgi:hypothetical protein